MKARWGWVVLGANLGMLGLLGWTAYCLLHMQGGASHFGSGGHLNDQALWAVLLSAGQLCVVPGGAAGLLVSLGIAASGGRGFTSPVAGVLALVRGSVVGVLGLMATW